MSPGAISKFGAPMFECEVFRQKIYCIEEGTLSRGILFILPHFARPTLSPSSPPLSPPLSPHRLPCRPVSSPVALSVPPSPCRFPCRLPCRPISSLVGFLCQPVLSPYRFPCRPFGSLVGFPCQPVLYPRAKIFILSSLMIHLSSLAERAMLFTCSVERLCWRLRMTFIFLNTFLPENKTSL